MIYGRRPRQLVLVWASALALIALIMWFETVAPVFHEILKPFYWIILAAAFYFTYRWLRSRSNKDRRGRDRRRVDRRDEPDSLTPDD
jgi:4-hydroxybenzoate polyprenyltransferase